MTDESFISEKKKKLLAYKQKILKEINNVERQIESLQTNASRLVFYDDEDSSDSDTEILFPCDPGPSLGVLRHQQSTLKLRLQATQELTGLQILQYEVNILVEPPVLENDTPVTEEGVWREVTVDCRIDLVPFLITFFVHQPSVPGAPPRYCGVRASAGRAQHARELSPPAAPPRVPADAVQVLRDYAVAHRSRRTSLAALADKYSNAFHIELMPEGGYLVKFGDYFQVSWVLVNKWSSLTPFAHNMKFQFEYMEESFVRRVQQVHKALSDPTIDTDGRTSLLDKLISICLEAKGEDSETMTSDQESVNKTTLDKADREMMAPPKSLPKKTKPKGKENERQNKKRPNTDNDDSVKLSKLESGTAKKVNSNKEASVKAQAKSVASKNKRSNNVKDVTETSSNSISNINKDSKSAVNKNKNTINKAVSNKETCLNSNTNEVSTKKQNNSNNESKNITRQDNKDVLKNNKTVPKNNKDVPKNNKDVPKNNKDVPKNNKINNKNRINNVPATYGIKERIISNNELRKMGTEINKKSNPKNKDKINNTNKINNTAAIDSNKELNKKQIKSNNERKKC